MELPTLEPAGEVPVGAPDIAISRELLSEEPEIADDACGYFREQGGAFEWCLRGVARYRVQGGRRIAIAEYPGAETERVRLFLMGSAMGALLYQRGMVLLHGSAVQTERGAMVFVGGQGEGKSTFAAHLHRRGYPLLSDDTCVVAPRENGFTVLPSASHLRLLEDAVASLEGWGPADERRFEIDKFVVDLPRVPQDPVPLAGVYLLDSSSPGEVAIAAVKGFEGVKLLLDNLYRGEYLRALARHGQVMQSAAAIARETTPCRIQRPRGMEHMPRVLNALEAHWQR
jgi:hypothetical protein